MLDARDDDRRRPVGRGVAVVEAQRRRDHPHRQVVVHRHRVAVDRLGVQRGVGAGVEGDLCQLLACRAVLVEVALGHHPDPVGGRRRPEGQRPLHEARRPVRPTAAAHRHRRPTLIPLGRRLPHGAEAQDVVAQAGRHGEHGVDHGTELAGQLHPTGEPVELEPQRVLQLGDPDAGEPRRDLHVAGVGGDAVDVGRVEAGVGDGLERGVDREVERVAVDAAAHLGLADARHDGAALAAQLLEGAHAAPPATSGSNSGSHTS